MGVGATATLVLRFFLGCTLSPPKDNDFANT